jgi:hypothetical protein
MRKITTFKLLNVTYRSQQYCADEGVRLLSLGEAAAPIDRLAGTEAKDDKGTFHPLDSRENINRHVRDAMAGVINPARVLDELTQAVSEFNFGFLNTYKPVKTPRRFFSDIEQNKLEQEDPHIERVIAAKYATLRELQEFYSTADLFRLLDVIANDNLNAALASEAARAEAIAKRK